MQKQHDTRNHRFALQQSHVHYDMCKFNFSNRMIPIWNSLPDYVVASPTINRSGYGTVKMSRSLRLQNRQGAGEGSGEGTQPPPQEKIFIYIYKGSVSINQSINQSIRKGLE